MINIDLLVIAPDGLFDQRGEPYVAETPYGAARMLPDRIGAQAGAWVAASASPFAAIYAAKAAGATRVVELVPVVAINRLLEPGDLLLPDDLADRTGYQRYTFFAGKGYGFLSQREPFCPVLRGALLAAARALTPRSFARGVYLAVEGPPPTAAPPAWEADIAGRGVVPTSFLARELEICYAPLCVVAAQDDGRSFEQMRGLLDDTLADALPRLPGERTCVCATAMQAYRDRGDIGPDWRTWIAV